MKVICVKDTGSKYLLKGQIYEATSINGDNIYIDGLSNQKKNKFSSLDGKPLPVAYNSGKRRSWRSELWELMNNGAKPGFSVTCKQCNLKSVKYGESYIVESYRKVGWNYRLKLKGVDKDLSIHNFNLTKKKENRNDRINDILDIIEEKKTNIEYVIKFLTEYQKFEKVRKNNGFNITTEEFISKKTTFSEKEIEKLKSLKIEDIL